MLTVYRLFQLIMGLFLSGFIFYILITYAGNYADLGGQAARFKTLDVFVQDADNVYLTGIPITFTGFSRDDFTDCHSRPGTPPRIFCSFDGDIQESEPLAIPILLKPDLDVLVSRGMMDLGWTQLYYVEALPAMTVIFNPIGTDDPTWDLMASVAETFPDTTGTSPKVWFDVCDGDELVIEAMRGSHYESRDFASAIRSTNEESREASFRCAADLSSRQVLVTISPSCSPSFANSGICIIPYESDYCPVCNGGGSGPFPDGLGYAFITGHPETFVYKDPVDLAALIIGGQGTDIFGRSIGGETHDSKNNVMLDHLEKAAAVMGARSLMLSTRSEVNQGCREIYLDLAAALEDVVTLSQGDHRNIDDMTALRSAIDQAGLHWDQLIYTGCEARGSG